MTLQLVDSLSLQSKLANEHDFPRLVTLTLAGHLLTSLSCSTVVVHAAETSVLNVTATPGLALIVFGALFSKSQLTTTF